MKADRHALLLVAAVLLLGGPVACGEDPFAVTWTANPDTVVLYSLARPELNRPSAFDFVPTNRRRVEIEDPGATGQWDLAVDTRDGALVFLPPGSVGVDSRAGVATFPGLTLDEIEEAPADTASYTTSEPVVVETGTVYVIRTRRSRGGFGRLCTFFGKLEPIALDPEAGIVRFVFDVNPECNDRSLVPDVTDS